MVVFIRSAWILFLFRNSGRIFMKTLATATEDSLQADLQPLQKMLFLPLGRIILAFVCAIDCIICNLIFVSKYIV
jgi:hypothetical protein